MVLTLLSSFYTLPAGLEPLICQFLPDDATLKESARQILERDGEIWQAIEQALRAVVTAE